MLSNRFEDDGIAKGEPIHLVGVAARSLQTGVSPFARPGSAAKVSREAQLGEEGLIRKIPGTLLIKPAIEAHGAGSIQSSAANQHRTMVGRENEPEDLHSSPVARSFAERLCIRILNDTMHLITMDHPKEVGIDWSIP